MKLQILLTSFLILLGLDIIYLKLTYKVMEDQIVSVQKFAVKPRILVAIACYLILFFGLYHFILVPKRSPLEAFILGIVLYGVYELTNYSIFKNWKLRTVVIDTLWGGILLGLTTKLTYLFE